MVWSEWRSNDWGWSVSGRISKLFAIFAAAVVGLSFIREAAAQAHQPAARRANGAMLVLADESANERAKRYADVFRERLDGEARLLEKLCHLPPEGHAALDKQKDSLLRTFNEELIRALTSSGPEGEKALLVAGQTLHVPRAFRLPRVFQRETLCEILAQAISPQVPDAMAKLAAEKRRLDERHRRADVLSRVASLDSAVLLDGEQRDELVKLLTPDWKTSWRRPLANNPLFNPAIRAPAALVAPFNFASAPNSSSGTSGAVHDGPVDISRILRPSQQAWWQALREPVKQRQEVVVVRRPAARQAAAKAAARQPVRQPAAGPVRAAQGGVDANVGVQPVLEGQLVVRRAAASEAEDSRLQALLERLVDDVDLTCGLSTDQRQKLLLAGKLDIQRQREGQQEVAAAGQVQPGDVVQVVRIAAALPMPSLEVFTDAGSRYQKFLHHRLSDDQAQKLAAAEHAREDFRWQAVRETLLATLIDARLTADQCDELARRLDEWRATRKQVSGESALGVLRFAGLAVRRWLPPLIDKWQMPSVSAALDSLERNGIQFEPAPAEAGLLP